MRDYDKMANLIANIKYDLERLDSNENITVRKHDDQLEYSEEEHETLEVTYAALKDDVSDLMIAVGTEDFEKYDETVEIILNHYYTTNEVYNISKHIDDIKAKKG